MNLRVLPLLALGGFLVVATALADAQRAAVVVSAEGRTFLLASSAVALAGGSLMVARRATAGLGAATWLAGGLVLAAQWDGLDGGDDLVRSLATLVLPLLPVALLQAASSPAAGAIESRLRRWVVGAAWAAGVTACVTRALVREPLVDPYCAPNCAVNSLLLRPHPDLAADLADALRWLAAACAIAAVGFAASRRPARLAWFPATQAAAIAAIAYAGLATPEFDPTATDERVAVVVECLALLVLAGKCAWLIARPVLARRAIARIAHRSASLGGLEMTLRVALADPTLSLAYPLEGGWFVDARGLPVELATFRRERSLTTIAGRSGPIALVAHAPKVGGFERRLGAAVALAIDNERLATTLNMELRRLVALRSRIVAVSDDERRRIERNLHDGAQRQLVALALELGIAAVDEELAPLAAQIEAVAENVDVALAQLREIAHSISPDPLGGPRRGAGYRSHHGSLGRRNHDGAHPLRVVICDDAEIVRHGLVRMLEVVGADIVGVTGDVPGLMRLVRLDAPDVAIVDIRLPPTHTDEGLVAAREIRGGHPATGVLVLSQYLEPDYATRLIEDHPSGLGYLLKERIRNPHTLADALERIREGECVVDPTIVRLLLDRSRAASPLDEISEREREILGLMAEGLSNRAIAARLVLSQKTVESHITHVFAKLGLRNAEDDARVRAVLLYLRG